MSGTSSASGNGPVAPSGPPQSTGAVAGVRPRSAAPRTQERRRGLIVGCGVLLVAALGVVTVMVAGSPISVHSLKVAPTASAMPDSDLRTAKITNASDGKGCWQQVFDNQTGRMTRSQQPCESTVYDSNGTPVPIGTIHRLDAISKSFTSH